MESQHFFLNLEPQPRAPFEIVCGGVEQVRPDYHIERDDFPFYGVELVASGEGELTLGGHKHPLSAGSLFAYGPGTPHQIRNSTSSGMRKYYLDLYGTQVAKPLRDAQLQTHQNEFTPIWVKGVHELTAVFDMLIHEANRQHPNAESICQVLTQLLFLKIQQLRLTDGSAPSKAFTTFERICLYIDENFLALRSARDIAAQCRVTPIHLSRLFQRFSEIGSYQYLLHRKMRYAAGLLVDGNFQVKDVAERVGIPDPYQFSRTFKRVYGYPPSRLTKSGR